jgi:competence protein ComEC
MSWPDAFVGDDGRLVAVRGPDQKLTAIRGPGSRFELERWLESEGDSRTARQAASGAGFRCDSVGCTATVKGKTIAVARHPAALIDDCSQADVLVIGFPKPANCQPSGPVIDFFMVRDKGTHVISIVDDTVQVTSVADLRGDRPWSRRVGPIRRTSTAAVEIENRIGTFAAPMDLTEAPRDIRPEIEDDDGPLPTEPDANQ